MISAQEVCVTRYHLLSAFSLLPAYYFYSTTSPDADAIHNHIQCQQWPPITLGAYRWLGAHLTLDITVHPLIKQLGTLVINNDTPAHTTHTVLCRKHSSFYLCYGAPSLAKKHKDELVAALPPLRAIRCRVLQYVVSEWRQAEKEEWWHETTQKIVHRTWIKLLSV